MKKPQTKLTQARLKKLLHYNPATGVFIYKVSRSASKRAGTPAGRLQTMKNEKRWVISIDGVQHLQNRLAFLYMTGKHPPPNTQIDHIDRNHQNDALWNLRLVSHHKNHLNRSQQRNSTTGFAGVTKTKNNKYRASIYLHGKQITLGTFQNPEVAFLFRSAAATQLGFEKDHGMTNTQQQKYLD